MKRVFNKNIKQHFDEFVNKNITKSKLNVNYWSHDYRKKTSTQQQKKDQEGKIYFKKLKLIKINAKIAKKVYRH